MPIIGGLVWGDCLLVCWGSGLIGGVELAQKVHSGQWAFTVDLRSGVKLASLRAEKQKEQRVQETWGAYNKDRVLKGFYILKEKRVFILVCKLNERILL